MNTDKLIQFFIAKLGKIPELRNLNNKDTTFTTWWNTITSTCERMGEPYKKRADRVRFYPGVVAIGGDNSAVYARAYQSGLDSAEALIKSIMEELEIWGYKGEQNEGGESSTKQSSHDGRVILNLTISQQQAQQITQSINLAQYNPEVQQKVQELLEELKKESKDKPKIINVVKWLANKGADALIAILLAATHLT